MFWGADFLEQVVAFSKANAATSMSMFFAAIVVGRIAGRRLVPYKTSSWLLLAASGAAGPGAALFWLALTPVVNLVGFCSAGLGIANMYPLTLAAATNCAPLQTDQASTRITLATGIAGLVAPFVIGSLADRFTIQRACGAAGYALHRSMSAWLGSGRSTGLTLTSTSLCPEHALLHKEI